MAPSLCKLKHFRQSTCQMKVDKGLCIYKIKPHNPFLLLFYRFLLSTDLHPMLRQPHNPNIQNVHGDRLRKLCFFLLLSVIFTFPLHSYGLSFYHRPPPLCRSLLFPSQIPLLVSLFHLLVHSPQA